MAELDTDPGMKPRASELVDPGGAGQGIFERQGAGQLLSGPGGVLEVPAGDRRLLAAFQGGMLFIAKGSRWSPEVKAVLDRAFRAEIDILRIVETDGETILSAYEAGNGAGDSVSARRSEIERQRELRRTIARAADLAASDVHFKVLASHCEIKARVNGRLRNLVNKTAEDGIAIINAAFAVAVDQGSEAGATHFMKGSLTRASGLLPPGIDGARLQYSPTSGRRAFMAMRLKYASGGEEAEVAGLGYLPTQLSDLAVMRRRTSGLYLLSGKVSSGKTTTLQRLLNAMVREKAHEISVFAIEEPVELDIAGAVHLAVTPKTGQTRSEAFVDAIRAALRSDPNLVVLGELRDRQLAAHAIELAMTGHALWSTVHAGSALGILDRLSDLGVEPWKLADPSIVRGLLYQRLVGVLCNSCKTSYRDAVDGGALEKRLAFKVMELTGRPSGHLFVRGEGCSKCRNGISGRSVVAETILPDPTLLDLYVRGERAGMRTHWLAPVQRGGLGGMPVMHHAMLRVGQGVCDINEVEEEVELVSSYIRDNPDHAASLASGLGRTFG